MQLSLFSTLWKTSPLLSVVLKMSSPRLVEDSPCAVNTESLRQSGERSTAFLNQKCLFMCKARWSDLEKALSQRWHWKGRWPVCFL